MELGERIRTLRVEKGLSQEALAEQLEVSRQAVAKWEGGQSRPSTANLLALCGVFGVPLERLVSGEDASEPEESMPAQNPATNPPRPGNRRGKMVLLAVTLLSLVVSAAATDSARRWRLAEELIGGADGPTAILVTGPILDYPPHLYLLWGLTVVLAVVTVAAFLRGRRRR